MRFLIEVEFGKVNELKTRDITEVLPNRIQFNELKFNELNCRKYTRYLTRGLYISKYYLSRNKKAFVSKGFFMVINLCY
jgi:hypothetical protein